MSDTPNENRWSFSGSDLNVDIDSRLVYKDQERIDEATAQNLIAARIMDALGGRWPTPKGIAPGDEEGLDKWMAGTSTLDSDLAEIIVDAIGKDNLNETLVNQIDLRPYFMQMVAKGDMEITQHQDANWMDLRFVGGTRKRPVSKENLQAVLDALNKQGADLALATAHKDMSPEEVAKLRADVAKVDPKKAGLSPAAQATVFLENKQSMVNDDGSLASADAASGDGGSGLLPAQEAIDMFMIDGTQDISRLIEAEGSMQTEPSEFSNNELMGLADATPKPQWLRGDVMLPDKSAALLITSGKFTPSQIRRVQDKLMKAGYFDGLDAPVMGDPSDLATQKAWFRALGDRRRNPNKPLGQLVAERTKARMDLNLSRDERVSLNQLAFQTLGRRLDPAELHEFEKHLMSFKGGQRPATGMNPDGTSSSTSFSENAWFTPGQAQQTLLTEYEPELQRTQSAASTSDAVNGMSAWFKDLGVG